jgi:phenylalanyl-tRNA synthetase beta chain
MARQQNNLRLFEIGKIFMPQPDVLLPLEREMLLGIWSGLRDRPAWHTRDAACDFFDIKGTVEGLASALGIDNLSFAALPDDQCCYTRVGHTAQIHQNGQVLGIVGEVDETVLTTFSLKQAAFIFELDLEILAHLMPENKQMTPIPRYPSTSRDITVIVDQAIESNRLLDVVTQFGETLVEDLHLFDVFIGDPIPDGKKSLSIRIIYRSAERTLDDESVNDIHRQITHRLITEFDAALPA